MILVIKHIAIEGLGTAEEYFTNSGPGLHVVDLSAGDQLPEDLAGIAGVISLGGPMNVYETDRHPFLAAEDSLIKKVLRQGMPFLGICLGSQLLAKAAGAEVRRAPEKEMGFKTVFLTEDGLKDPLLRGVGRELTVFQWHGDTFDLPVGGTLLATGRECRHQAFRVGPCAYGFQFHMEVARRDMVAWCDAYLNPEHQKEHDMRQTMLRDYRAAGARYHRAAAALFENFYRIIVGKCACCG